MIILFKFFCSSWRFLNLNKRWCSLKDVSHVKQFEGVARSYFDLCVGNRLWLLFSLNIFLILFEQKSYLLKCELVNLWNYWLVFARNKSIPTGFPDLKGECLFLALAVANLISSPLIIIWAACAPAFVNLSTSSFWVIPQCAGEHVMPKEKHFSELLMRIIYCTLSWCISRG